VKIALSFFVLLISIILVVLVVNRSLFKETLSHSETELSRSITNILKISINRISFSGKYHAQVFADKLITKEESLMYIYIINDTGRTIAKSVSDQYQKDIEFNIENYQLLYNKIDDDSYVIKKKTCCRDVEYNEIIMPYQVSVDRAKSGLIIAGISTFSTSSQLKKNSVLISLVGIVSAFIGLILIFLLANNLSYPIRSMAIIFKSFLEHAPMGIIIRKKNGEVVETSNSFNHKFNAIPISDISKQSYHSQWHRAFYDIDSMLEKGSGIVKKEFKFLDGNLQDNFSTISFEIDSINEKDENLFCTIAINTNEEKKFKEQLEKRTLEARKASQAKTSFLATMSHEIRTPLTSIIGFLGLLSDTEQDEKQIKYTKTAFNSSENLLALINDILDYSKIESEDFKLEMTKFSIVEMCKNVEEIFKFQAKEKNLHFAVTISPEISEFVSADEIRIRQILVNLIGNSIKFTSVGSVICEVELRKLGVDSQTIRISVRDTGIGLKKSQIAQIFDQFSQADNSISRKFGGTGLGLSITKKLVELMKGSIHVESEYGKGSLFYLDLKLDVVEAPSVTTKSTKDGSFKDFTTKKVLVVDDEESNRQLIELYMKKLGISPDLASDGFEAIKMVKENEYDMILMDIQMPECDGVQALKGIREFETLQMKQITPVYAFTANVFREQLDEYHSLGFNGHLTKPFKKNDLLNFLKEYLV
jgi:signal transduction histidine kinase/CheY-like chemotaxis protein